MFRRFEVSFQSNLHLGLPFVVGNNLSAKIDKHTNGACVKHLKPYYRMQYQNKFKHLACLLTGLWSVNARVSPPCIEGFIKVSETWVAKSLDCDALPVIDDV